MKRLAMRAARLSRPADRRLRLELLEARRVLSTYYVATGGNDGAAGSQAAPWKTLQHAVDAVSPGDTILVAAGTYAGCRIESSGTAAAPCTLAAAPGAAVLVNAPGPRNRHQSDIEVESFDGTIRYWTIDGFEVSQGTRSGIDVRDTDHIAVQNCHVHGSGLTGIFTAFSDYVVIQHNHSHDNGEHGVYHSNSGDFPVIRGNVLDHNFSCGVHMNGDVSQGGDGQITGALVEGNVVYENGAGGGSGINADGVSDSRFQNNLVYSNHASGLSLYQIDGASSSTGNVVVNNTIRVASNGRWAVNIQDGSTGNRVVNNILLSDHATRGAIDISADSLGGFVSDYNVVLSRFTTNDSATILSLSAWRAQTGQDAHSLISTAAALFAAPASGDYHLSATSTAIDAGTSAGAPATDLEGWGRPAGAGWDIGAYETHANLVVTNTADAGAGSLRQAILDANAAPGASTIAFAIGGTSPHVIALAAPLPNLSDATTLDLPAGMQVDVGGASTFGFGDFTSLVKTGSGSLIWGGGDVRIAGDALTLSAGAVKFRAAAGGLLVVNALAIAPGATLNLADSDLVVRATPATRNAVLASVTGWIATGAAGLAWNGPGITSSAAAGDPAGHTALGVMLNDNGGLPYRASFSGQAVTVNDVLVKYTYYGDADLSGTVDGTDYALADNGFNGSLAGWFHGNFDYAGAIDGTDFALIDNAFNSQGAPLAAAIAPAVSAPVTARRLGPYDPLAALDAALVGRDWFAELEVSASR